MQIFAYNSDRRCSYIKDVNRRELIVRFQQYMCNTIVLYTKYKTEKLQ